MSDSADLSKLVPGFEFLQSLAKSAGSVLPGMGQWVAPTLDPKELDKRIEELRTVQFWLEQNTRMLAATLQALEVQRMTLSTLKTMNVRVADLRESLTIKPPASAASPAGSTGRASATPPAGATTPGQTVDPMQWWGALTEQFTQLATKAMKDGAAAATHAAASTVAASTVAAKTVTAKTAAAPRKAAARRRVAGAKR